MTYRERRERRVETLRDRADRSEARSQEAYDAEHRIGDQIPMGQPILIGHHSQRRAERDRDRMQALASRSVEESRKAERQASSATEIERQLEVAIFDDDPDAVERLEEKIAGLEAERARFKAYNASCRKGSPDESLLSDAGRAGLKTVRTYAPYQLGKKGELNYSNLTANIARLKKRLEGLKAPERGRRMSARFSSECSSCGETIEEGATIVYYKRTRRAVHEACDG